MMNYEEICFLKEINKGLNLLTVSSKNIVILGKCIENLEAFILLKEKELLLQNNSSSDASLFLDVKKINEEE